MPEPLDDFARLLEAARDADQYWVCNTCGADIGETSGCEECSEWVQEMIHYGALPSPDERIARAARAEADDGDVGAGAGGAMRYVSVIVADRVYQAEDAANEARRQLDERACLLEGCSIAPSPNGRFVVTLLYRTRDDRELESQFTFDQRGHVR